MHEAVPLYSSQGAVSQFTACACADGVHPIHPMAISAVSTPARTVPAGREAVFPPDALPRGEANSETTTS
ncbi:hypothetical protein ASD53_14945 [Lysobacter sp. Root559]|nr:hypothetical protein ASD53_14945 [Lysobacter sp. Root559]KRA70718.1 hypothetical protein ASD78_17975 [Lysobacter sp. Root667]KRC31504.1 hypothetical protein ASE10_17390 [Lysobacter sp. Root76]KRD65411.1 hypothetical protein ASE45_18585 [Lysobacter sp. Root96]